MTSAWMNLLVAHKWREAAEVYGYELVDPAGGELPPFTPGAHVDVEPRPGLVRQYSLCGPPSDRRRYRLGVLRESGSRGGSQALIDQIDAGDRLRVSAPRNHFGLDESASHALLIAGGIGITPILCMAQHLHEAGRPFDLHYAARSREHAAFLAHIRSAGFSARVNLYFSDGPANQRLDLAMVLAGADEGAHLYVCGPNRLTLSALETAEGLGWASARVHREFFAPPGSAEGAPNRNFEVVLSRSGRAFTIPEDRSIADVLIDHGVDVSTSCEQGVCGSCLTRVLSGIPDHRDCFLTLDERRAGDQMTICCSRAKTARLVLDL